jgi:hypothetical protein
MVNIVVHAWQGIAMHRLSGFADGQPLVRTTFDATLYDFQDRPDDVIDHLRQVSTYQFTVYSFN